ncbi:tRNA (cytidine/uridine-2'-O-)-methyltransferase TrmJ [Methyloligella halotolerans]|uniref:tRNA (Cytidine/uridine-2'-O-)-methyltransferase TrmJ n=1 Tax=Methyloligella halotolerans TaxID=1177755 RepID=A0A1E2S2Z9_9HYPH|nr:RNA methyltransferase [Methyloligella halotolerans]ODA68886.1 tRNA (cytidine/uridine-2'-O-)-methyltransferase TrmJ [Methyloligella halotolerans]
MSRASRASTKDKAAAQAVVGPAIVLVRPQLGENIGFAARAMANFGLADLRLVAPRDGWPNEKATAAAAGAYATVDSATLYETTELALAKTNYVIATTARPRDMVKPVMTPESAAAELLSRQKQGQTCAILFGPERSGLDNDDIGLVDALVTAPVNPAFASLSLPQTVLLIAYEWQKQAGPGGLGRATRFDGPAREGTPLPNTRPAEREEMFGLFEHLEAELDAHGFLRPAEKRPTMVRNIRNMFHRMQLTEQDVRTWRGIVSSLTGGKRRNP